MVEKSEMGRWENEGNGVKQPQREKENNEAPVANLLFLPCTRDRKQGDLETTWGNQVFLFCFIPLLALTNLSLFSLSHPSTLIVFPSLCLSCVKRIKND